MDRLSEFEARIDALIEEFSDLSYEDLADSFECYTNNMLRKARLSETCE